MKKNIFILSLLIVLILSTGCPDPNEPPEVNVTLDLDCEGLPSFIPDAVTPEPFVPAPTEGPHISSPAATANPAAVSISIGVFGDLETFFNAVIDSSGFQARFPNVSVELSTGNFGSHHSRLNDQLDNGTWQNHIETMDNGFLAVLAEAGSGYTDLVPYDGLTAGADLASFAMANATTSDGKLIAMPLDLAPAVMFYRKSIIDGAGIDMENLPSWQDYVCNASKVTVDFQGDGIYDQFALTHPLDASMLLLNGGKGDWFESGNPYEPESPFKNALILTDMLDDSGICADYSPWSGEWIDSFKENKVVTMFSGAWLGGHFENWICPELSGDWRMTSLPGQTYASNGGTYILMSDQIPAELKDICWEVIQYISTSPEAQFLNWTTTKAFPALTSVYGYSEFFEPVDYFGGQVTGPLMAEIALNIPDQNVSAGDVTARDLFSRAIDKIINEDFDVNTAYEQAKQEVLAQ